MAKIQEGFHYSSKPTNFFRAMLAGWRVIKDPESINLNMKEGGIVEIYFNCSKFGKRIARWDLVAKELMENHPETAEAFEERRRVGYLDVQKLLTMPEGSLGQTFAKCSIARGIDPNHVEPLQVDNDGEWLIAHMYETHDFHHLITGNAYDMPGEYGVIGFYMAQMPKNTFVAFMASILMLQRVWKQRDEIGELFNAISQGYQMGKKAKCLIGLDLLQALPRNLDELRTEYGIQVSDDLSVKLKAAA
jgi:ubiquinone biosynthesis protein COQ4